MTAFAAYTDASCLEHFPTVHLTRFSLTQALTCGVKTVIGTNRASASTVSVVPGTNSVLPDGRLKVGTNLPLLARRFRYLRLVGEGTSAQVILAEDTHSHKSKLVVIKVLKRHFAAAGHKELRALRFLQNREAAWQSGLVKLLSGFTHCGHVCLVLERLHGSLLDYVVHSARLHRSEALHNLRKIAAHLLGCLALMHSKGVVHADIKPENILLTSPPESGNVGVKLIDLGNCFSPTGTDTSRISFEMQTLPFRAPEALTGGACGTGIDVWSLGCVLAEVALQRPLFPIITTSELIHQMTAQLGQLPPSIHPSSPAQASPAPASPIMLAQAAPPTHISDHQGTYSVQNHSWSHGQQVESIVAQAGPLKMWHERASPLHLELAKVDPSMASLVMSMLDYDPQTRMSAAQALSHPFLKGLSPALQLPQSKAHSSAEAPEEAVTTNKVHLHAAGSLIGVSLPFRPEPKRQLAVKVPIGASAAVQASSASWMLPLPNDPLLRAPEPQLRPLHPAQPPQLGLWRPPPSLNVQQHSPLKAAETKLEPPAKCDLQLAPPQLGPSHECSAPRLSVSLLPEQSLSPTTKPAQQLLEQPPLSGKLSHRCVRSSFSQAAKQGQHVGQGQDAEQGQRAEHDIHDPIDTPRLVPSAVDGPTTAAPATAGALAQPSDAGIPACAAAEPLSVGSGSPAAAVARQPQAPPADGSTTATLADAQLPRLVSDPKGNAPALEECSLQAQHQLASAATHTVESPIAGHAQDAKHNPGEEPAQGLLQTLGQSAQAAVHTPGVVRAWNRVTRVQEKMTPGSEAQPPPPSLSEALRAAGFPQRPTTTHPSQLALLSAQSSTDVIAQHQQLLDQQQQKHQSSQQVVFKEAAVIEQGQPGEGRANLPSWISPKPEQDHSSQQESHVSASHVSQSPDSSSSHGLAASQQVSHEQRSRQEHVTVGHMLPEFATSQASSLVQASQPSLQTTDKPDQAMSAAEPIQAMSEHDEGMAADTEAHALKPAGTVDSPALAAKSAPMAKKERLASLSGVSGQKLPWQLQKPHQLPCVDGLLTEDQPWQQQQQGGKPKQKLFHQKLSHQKLFQQQQQQESKLSELHAPPTAQAHQLSRAGSREASAIPAESQQSAVHALGRTRQTQPAQERHRTSRECVPQASALIQKALSEHQATSGRGKRQWKAVQQADDGVMAKRNRRSCINALSFPEQEVEVGQTVTEAKHICAQQAGRKQSTDAVELHKPQEHVADLHSQGRESRPAVDKVAGADVHADALVEPVERQVEVNSECRSAAAASTDGPAAMRNRRSRDRSSDANKPWWVV
ncbi:TPA: hypothetical protein ACH3X1_001720 [Trebouxia sp. C0004]